MNFSTIKWLLVQVVFTPIFVFGQEGIQFESHLSWKDILTEAKSEKKFIFLDCYTTWCGPCKFMNAEIFSKKQVGDYFNARFINVAVQMDKTAMDCEEIKAWYSKADSISKQFKVNSYPTYLFFSSDGQILHRVVGRTTTIQEFIAKGKDAVDSSKQFYTLMEHWREHKNDSFFLLSTLKASLDAADEKQSIVICDDYIESLRSPISRDNIKLFEQLIHSSKDKSFKFFLKNMTKIDTIMGDVYAERVLSPILFKEEIAPFFLKENIQLNWKKITSHLKNMYPTLGDKLVSIEKEEYNQNIRMQVQSAMPTPSDSRINCNAIIEKLEKKMCKQDFYKIYLEQKAGYYANKNQWPECLNTTYSLMWQYGNEIDDRDMDNIAWDYVFLHCNNPKIIQETLKWMERAIFQKPDQPNNIDTYANLLYKIGQRDQAIFWEGRAIEIDKKNDGNLKDLKTFNDNLEKMKKGEQTWNENS
jgi:thioredoxin-related protein